jgi:hypothetical protein
MVEDVVAWLTYSSMLAFDILHTHKVVATGSLHVVVY